MRILAAAAVLILTSSGVFAQVLPAPTRTPAPTSPAQEAVILAGITLHDQAKYDEAIARYQEVLKESPDNVTALFELAYSQLEKKDYQATLATARKGAEFKSELLSMFYDLMGSAYDASGEPQQAVAVYKRGIELAPDANLYFNLAVTYRESLKDPDQARLALEKAVSLDPERADAPLLLGQLFQAGGYRSQALLTLSHYLVLEPTASRSLQGYGLWRAMLRGTSDTAMTGDRKTPDRPAKMDEGDFAAFDAFIDVTHKAATTELDKGTPELTALIAQFDALVGRFAAQSATVRESFVGSRYVPFFVELRRREYVEPFVYWASQRAPTGGAREWVNANRDRVLEFLKWSESYRWP